MQKILRRFSLGILCFIAAGLFSSLAAEQISISTTFSCETNADCKRKCEALGDDHVWKPNPGGSPLGTCTKRAAFSPPSRETLKVLNVVTANSEMIEQELNNALSRSPTLRARGVAGVELGSFSIVLKGQKQSERICMSCLGAGFAVEMCCPSNNPNCFNPCTDGQPILLMAPD